MNQNERALVTFDKIEDERGGLARYELINFDSKVYFLREAIDNKGGPISERMAWAVADEQADKIRDKGQSLETHFYHYDRKEEVWSVYRFTVDHEKPGFTFEHKGFAPQCLLEKKFGFQLERSIEEYVKQTISDLRHMNSKLPAEREHIERGLASNDLQTRLKADLAHDALLEKEALQEETKATLEKYLTLRGAAAQAGERASTIEGQMRETMNERFQDAKEEERERNRGR
jgi:hypothetical protein